MIYQPVKGLQQLRQPERGLFFAELAVALVVLGIALTIVASLVFTSRDRVRESQEKLAARYIAEHQLSLLRLDAVSGKPIPDRDRQEVPPELPYACGRGEARCLLTVAEARDGQPGLKKVVVTVQWPGIADRPREYSLESLVAERRR